MKIACALRAGYKKKGEKDDRYYWSLGLSYIRQYEELPKEYDIIYELYIYHLLKKNEEGQILESKKFIKTGDTTHYIHFASVSYIYNEKSDQILCCNLIQKI